MFSERLKKLREDKGLSQAEFAKIIGVERTRYGKWENKGFEPPYETLVKIADYFDVSTDYLLCRTDYPHGYIQKAPHELEDAGLEQVVKTKDEPLTPDEIEELRRFLKQLKG